MNWWQYLILVNVYLLLFYIFYVVLLSRETFFQLNRIYLVMASLLSFFIPLIQSDWVKSLFITQKVQYTIYSSPVLLYRFKTVADTHLTMGQIFIMAYFTGIVFLLLRFVWQIITLNKFIKQLSNTAYSFFKKVNLGDDAENQAIIAAHENTHARQWHSADVLVIEAVMIINWFNPVVYLYRFAIKHIHEFIADNQAIKLGASKAEYAIILLCQTFNAPAHQLVNPFFNKSLLKKRILMLQKNKSQRIALIKYFLSAPLFILMLVLSSASVNNSKAIRAIDHRVQSVLLKPASDFTGRAFNPQYIFAQANKSAIICIAKNSNNTIEQDTTPKKDDIVFTAVEQVPQFPGGFTAFGNFLAKNVRYPSQARENNVQGRVIVSFIVETDGSLSNFKIMRGIGYGADEESIRVLAISPKWQPGTQNGKKVRVEYSVPINFTLGDSKPVPVPENKSGAVPGVKGTVNSIMVQHNTSSLPDTGKSIADLNLNKIGGNPLYIVDGTQTGVDGLRLLDPKDIESVKVIKDKTSIALYGAKGANGVIIITTKAGKLNPVLSAPKTDYTQREFKSN